MVKLKDLLTEGVMDQGILKAVFLAGGPGSGKTFVAGELFGIPKKVNVSAFGLKMVNQDKELTKDRQKMYMNGRLGMIIDGTGHNYQKIVKRKKELEEIGYDCYMVFVHTDLDIAQKRNMERPRKLNPEIVEQGWGEVQKNKIYFQGLFGNANFMMIDNSNTLSPKQATKKFNMLVKKGIGSFVKKPVKNYRGKKWVERQLILKGLK